MIQIAKMYNSKEKNHNQLSQFKHYILKTLVNLFNKIL